MTAGPSPRQRASAPLTARPRIAVIDDDPTGSQAVHEVDTVLDPAALSEIGESLTRAGAVCFVLTNSRSMPAAGAAEVNYRLGTYLARRRAAGGPPVTVVSRSDSTLRGHFTAEIQALTRARLDVLGAGYDAIVICPAFLEAGRITVGNIHLARSGEQFVPVGETEYARDVEFGYSSSDLREFIAERTGGQVRAADVLSIGLDDIRVGGVGRVASLLDSAVGGRYVVLNASEQSDLDILASGIARSQAGGKELLLRTGPSLIRALAGLSVAPPLTTAELWPGGRRPGFGAVFVGSHVQTTSSQLDVLLSRGLATGVELQAGQVLDDRTRSEHLAKVTAQAARALDRGNVAVYTSRAVVGAPGAAELEVARRVSAALSAVASGLATRAPAWVVGKGGITSHDVAVSGLGIRRARVLGQLLPGLISVLQPVSAPAGVIGLPYVVFAGNVGDTSTLAYVVQRMAAR